MRSILDFHPVNEAVVATSGAEPTLRELVFSYYAKNIENEEEALVLAREYCLQIEAYALSKQKLIITGVETSVCAG